MGIYSKQNLFYFFSYIFFHAKHNEFTINTTQNVNKQAFFIMIITIILSRCI